MTTLGPVLQKLNAKVGDVMTEDVHTATTNTPIAKVADLMAQHHLRRIVVVDEHKRVCGVVSQRDILKHYTFPDEEPASEDGESSTAGQIQTLITNDTPITVSPQIPLIKAAYLLATNKIGCLPVVVGPSQQLKGLLSTTDMLRHIIGYGHATLESKFEFYTPHSKSRPTMPAYIRKMTGDLLIPLPYLGKGDASVLFALLGHDSSTRRIIVKLVDESQKSEGAIRTNRDKEHLIIPASGFVGHFALAGKTTAYDVSSHKGSPCLILTPRATARAVDKDNGG